MGRWTAIPRAVIIDSVVSANDTDGLRAGSLFGRTRAEVEHALPDREDVPCPSCRTRPHLFGVDFQGLHLARCSTCGLEFQSPRPVFEQLSDAVYGAAITHRNRPSSTPSANGNIRVSSTGWTSVCLDIDERSWTLAAGPGRSSDTRAVWDGRSMAATWSSRTGRVKQVLVCGKDSCLMLILDRCDTTWSGSIRYSSTHRTRLLS